MNNEREYIDYELEILSLKNNVIFALKYYISGVDPFYMCLNRILELLKQKYTLRNKINDVNSLERIRCCIQNINNNNYALNDSLNEITSIVYGLNDVYLLNDLLKCIDIKNKTLNY